MRPALHQGLLVWVFELNRRPETTLKHHAFNAALSIC